MSKSHSLSGRLNDSFEAIDAAGLGLETWPTALAQLRDLMGSRVAQLIGIGKAGRGSPDCQVPLNWTTEADDWADLVEAGAVDIRVSSRRRASLASKLLAVHDEASFDTEGDSLKYPAYGDFLRRWDYPYVCLSPVARSPEITVNLSVTRGAAQGGLNAEGKRLFASLAARVRRAVITQEVLQRRTLESLATTFDQISQNVFICSADRKVLASTRGGEALLSAGDRLTGMRGCLNARMRNGQRHLSEAIANGCNVFRTVAASPVVLYDVYGERPLVLEVIPVPGIACDLWGSPVVLVVARELDAARAAAKLARLGAATFDFTSAEEAVARWLLAGRSPTEAAQALGVTVGTVRVHVRNIYAKANVRSQLAFAALMGALR
ncbi:MAG: helix-turn-helix transcriptional regulator [Novosphingobium sp.]|nr:helix-turn-helix transcriptional regulator [Novosphingobium sp.]